MRKSDLMKNHDPFDEAVARYRGFMKKVIDAQRVLASAAEKRDIAESVILRLCANWEKFVDEHLVDCVNCDSSKLGDYLGVKTIPRHLHKDMCTALLVNGGYLDFQSFGALKGFSKKVLPEAANPFLEISKSNAKKIDEAYKIRNYLSHYSQSGRRALKRIYVDEYHNNRFLEPGQFLLAYNAKRLWTYFDAFQGASDKMKLWYVLS